MTHNMKKKHSMEVGDTEELMRVGRSGWSIVVTIYMELLPMMYSAVYEGQGKCWLMWLLRLLDNGGKKKEGSPHGLR